MSWDRLKLITPPEAAVLDLASAKAQIDADYDDDDSLVEGAVAAALASIDGPKGAGIALLTQTWQLTLDGWLREIVLPLGPFQQVKSVTYVSLDGSIQTLDPSMYVVDDGSDPVTITRAFGVAWPSTRLQKACVKVQFVCGFGDDASNVPADLIQAMKLLVSHWYQNRDAVVGVDNRDSSTELPLGVTWILDRYRPSSIA